MSRLPWLLVIFLLAGGRKASKPAGFKGGGKNQGNGKKGRPPGNPPGGCVPAPALFPSEEYAVMEFQNAGYNVMKSLYGPDGKLGTGDAEPDLEVLRFQYDYNMMSRAGMLGPHAGGLDEDGLTGWCTLHGLAHALETYPSGWAVEVQDLTGG